VGLLERWDERNQRVLEEHNRRYKAEQAAGGGIGAAGAALAWYAVGRTIGKGLFDVRPWFLAVGVVLLGLGCGVGLFLATRRRSSRT
jgi:divalent metal cation (Fe/Co/Zn/Cd) transporter